MNVESRIRVVGIVTAKNDQGIKVQVPFGEYTMRKGASEVFTLTGEGGLTFSLELGEVARYTGSRDLRALSGPGANEAGTGGVAAAGVTGRDLGQAGGRRKMWY